MSSNNPQFTLFELNKLIKEVISKSLPDSYWVIAEISEVNEHSSGHCYLELIQKDELSDGIKAKARANIWSYTYRMLKPYFETMTNRPLSRGIKILVNVQIVFHELYGYSLNITDIEPGFTLGDIELKKRETITKLSADGVMDMNKEQEFPVLPKRIAIISSLNAAGFQDFINQLIHNQFGYEFEYEVFPSTMQGDDAEKSIVNSLNAIYEKLSHFDVAVIVRGGGAQADLSCFDSYQLSSNIAQFPLPILTGIGHDKDVSVADMVAHLSLKTPTAVAEFLISKFSEAESKLNGLAIEIEELTSETVSIGIELLRNLQLKLQYYGSISISSKQLEISNLSKSIPYISKQLINRQAEALQTKQAKLIIGSNSLLSSHNSLANSNSFRLKKIISQKFNDEKLKHRYIEKTAQNLNPENILQKGYSITYHNGKVLKSTEDVKVGEEITTQLKIGKLIGNIVNKQS